MLASFLHGMRSEHAYRLQLAQRFRLQPNLQIIGMHRAKQRIFAIQLSFPLADNASQKAASLAQPERPADEAGADNRDLANGHGVQGAVNLCHSSQRYRRGICFLPANSRFLAR